MQDSAGSSGYLLSGSPGSMLLSLQPAMHVTMCTAVVEHHCWQPAADTAIIGAELLVQHTGLSLSLKLRVYMERTTRSLAEVVAKKCLVQHCFNWFESKQGHVLTGAHQQAAGSNPCITQSSNALAIRHLVRKFGMYTHRCTPAGSWQQPLHFVMQTC